MHVYDRVKNQPLPDYEVLLEKERSLFEKEYDRYYIKGETKPKTIGEPYLLHNHLSKKGVLLVHGLMAAPEEVREWAEFLYSKGYTVYAPRLAGHGTSALDLSTRCFEEWMESVDRGHAILKTCCEKIVIGGFSTGAGLALYQALKKPNDFDAVVSISAPLSFKGLSSDFVELLHAWNLFSKGIGKERFCLEYVTNHPDNPEINYHRCPVKGIVEVRALMRRVYRCLPDLRIPSLIIQGKNDPKVDRRSGLRLSRRIRASESYYREIDFHLHGIIRGIIARNVFNEVEKFLNTL